jgi:very-short-patch-repair endonuclease
MMRNEKGQFLKGKKSFEFENKRREALGKKGAWNKGLKGAQVAWNKGIPQTEEHKQKQREAMKKLYDNPNLRERQRQNTFTQFKNMSQDKKRKMYEGRKGKPTWNKGKRGMQVAWNKGLPQTIEFKERISRIKKEQIKNNLRLYNQLVENRKKQTFPKKDSSIEIKIQGFLKQLGIEFFTHQYIQIPHPYQCDIFIPSMNLVIECDGIYWHKYPTRRDIDNIRTNELLKGGFKVLRLWEFEINDMNLETFRLALAKFKSNNI